MVSMRPMVMVGAGRAGGLEGVGAAEKVEKHLWSPACVVGWSVGWSSSCAPNCETSTQPDWNGVPTWAAAVDHHSITGYRSHTWTNTEPAPKNVDELILSSALDFDSALVPEDDGKKTLATWADVDEVRCDSLFPSNTRGCIFQKYPQPWI